MRRLILVLLALTLTGVVAVTAQNTAQDAIDQFLCENAATESANSFLVSGGILNIYDPQRQQSGNAYCRILVRDSNFWQPVEEIGNLDALNRGVIQAIDVFGLLPEGNHYRHFNTPVRVCMRGAGDVLFLDATDSLRHLTTLFSWEAEAGYSCAEISHAGTVMLVPHGPAGPDPLAAADPATMIPLVNCEVTTAFNGLKLRREPSTSARIRYLFEDGVTLPATGKAGNWFQVVFNNQPGWLNAAFVTTSGACGDA